MANSSYDIDGMVQKVLETIRTGGAGADSQDGSQLTVTSRVVTLEQIEGRLGGVRQLNVPRQAVVTPSARDLLHKHDVALTFSTENKANGPGKTAVDALRLNLVAAVVEGAARFGLDALARALAADGIDVEPSSSDCLMETTERLAARFDDDGDDGNDGELAAIITSHPAAALCLANRLQGVRAVCPASASDVLPATNDIGANLIVIDPAARGVFQVKQMIREFCLSGRHTCPEILAARLG